MKESGIRYFAFICTPQEAFSAQRALRTVENTVLAPNESNPDQEPSSKIIEGFCPEGSYANIHRVLSISGAQPDSVLIYMKLENLPEENPQTGPDNLT